MIPWENIRKIGLYRDKTTSWRGWFDIFGFFGADDSVGFQFKTGDDRYDWAYFSAHFTNYTNSSVVEIMEKFQQKAHDRQSIPS